VNPDHVHLVAGPLSHSAPGGFAVYAHMVGNTVVVMRKFDAEEALHTIQRHRCTTTFMAPTLLKRIVDLPPAVRARYDVSSMRSIVVAAAPCPMRVKEEVIAYFGPVLYEFYGSTELGINTVLRPADVLRKPGSCGMPAPGVELAVLGDDGARLPPGEPGELFVRRYDGVFDAYYKNPQATKDTARGDWLSVGDVAWIDADGFVYICDRKRDMIISGGVNIYPAEIEDVLHRHPAIEDAAVFGVPDPEWGERVHAAVQLRTGTSLSPRDVIDFCRGRLADYKAPRDVSFHTDFPRDTAGKLVKRTLREPFWAGRDVRV
jgi:acyl-CoA synthetase (AMP-forming)/AMP-acid ligase II